MTNPAHTEKPITLEELDDYLTAAAYLIGTALRIGDGRMLRATKTLMDAVKKDA